MLNKVISGGQTGADRAGLIAAKFCGIPTGGWINKGFITEKGNEPHLAAYGLQELDSIKYPVRTLRNVYESDATLIFYREKLELGSALTKKYCLQLVKPHLTINIEEDVGNLNNWLITKNIKVLNIAGNRESKAPGIQEYVTKLLIEVFKKEREN